MLKDRRDILIGILVLLNLAMAALLWQSQRGSKPQRMGNAAIPRLLDMSKEQAEQVKQATDYFKTSTKPLRDRLDLTRQRMMEVLASDPPDRIKASMFASSTGPIHIELNQRLMDHYLDLHEICEPGQREKLAEVFRDIVLRHRDGPPPPRR